MSSNTTDKPAFVEVARLSQERHSTMLRNQDRGVYVTADVRGEVAITWCAGGCTMRANIDPVEARLLAAELLTAAAAAEAAARKVAA